MTFLIRGRWCRFVDDAVFKPMEKLVRSSEHFSKNYHKCIIRSIQCQAAISGFVLEIEVFGGRNEHPHSC